MLTARCHVIDRVVYPYYAELNTDSLTHTLVSITQLHGDELISLMGEMSKTRGNGSRQGVFNGASTAVQRQNQNNRFINYFFFKLVFVKNIIIICGANEWLNESCSKSLQMGWHGKVT